MLAKITLERERGKKEKERGGKVERERERERESTYYCIDFLHDGSFSQVNGLFCADESYFSLNVTARRRGNIDFAAC
jgi:hypothetical protein